jgi:hypothetical protein
MIVKVLKDDLVFLPRTDARPDPQAAFARQISDLLVAGAEHSDRSRIVLVLRFEDQLRWLAGNAKCQLETPAAFVGIRMIDADDG